jgi:hypothetical protein
MKLLSFGCSFMAGTELTSDNNTWPAVVADQLGLDHVCYAQAGIGNLQIMDRVLDKINQAPDDLYVINWTWIDRFDFIDIQDERWHTLRPALDHDLAADYFRSLHSQYRDMLTNLSYIHSTIQCLTSQKTRFFMTYMDDLLFEPVQKNWHASRAVEILQTAIRPYLENFQEQNLLDWSRDRGYPVSDQWHPLDQAHAAAAELMLPKLQQFLS